jgi:hypothetical protein
MEIPSHFSTVSEVRHPWVCTSKHWRDSREERRHFQPARQRRARFAAIYARTNTVSLASEAPRLS